MKLQAGTLVYALAISMVIGMITASVLLNAYFNRMLILRDVIREETAINAHSGIQYLCALNNSSSWQNDVDLFGREKDSVFLESRPWGVYDILVAKAHTGKETFQRIALAGGLPDSLERYALWLGDMDRALKVCGQTELRGKCFLPASGIERTYIEGKSYAGRELVYGPVVKSSRFIPEYNKERYSLLEQRLTAPVQEGDSLLSWSDLQNADSSLCSFDGPVCVVQENSPLIIDHQYLNGQFIIQSAVSVTVKAGATLINVLLVAPEIILEDQVAGQFQVVARDSIILGKDVQLGFPSALCLCSGKASVQQTGIVLREGSTLNGSIIAVLKEHELQRNTQITIQKECVVTGSVYCNRSVDLQGSIYGSLTCQRFVLTTNSATYENILLDGIIDVTKLPATIPGGVGFGSCKRKEVIQWLE